MFDDLRNSANDQSGFPENSDADLDPLLQKKTQADGRGLKLGGSNFLGMSAFQRFILSGLLLLLVFILGVMLVMITSSSLSF
jgi:hypothetical protein